MATEARKTIGREGHALSRPRLAITVTDATERVPPEPKPRMRRKESSANEIPLEETRTPKTIS